MVATARPIEHGQAMTNYATKDFRADIVKVNLLTAARFALFAAVSTMAATGSTT